MNRLDALFFPLFVVSVLVWSGLSIYVLLDRVVFDLRQRSRRRALAELTSPALQALPREAHTAAVEAVLNRLSASAQDRLIADPRMPLHVLEAFAAGLLARRGLAKLLRDAVAPSVGRGKWKRISALVVLARIRHDQAHPVLEKALADSDPDVAGTAVALLGHLRDRRAARLLIAALERNAFPASRIAAQLDQFPEDIVPLLLPLLDDPQAAVRYWGATLLGRFTARPELAAVLTARTRDADASVRKVAIQALGGFPGKAALEAALSLLEDPAPYVRAHALRTLGVLGNPGAAGRMAACLGDQDWWVRLAAKEALVALGEEAWPQVALHLESEDAFARNGAAEVLQNLGLLDRWVGEALQDPRSPAVANLARALKAGGRGMFQATLNLADPVAHNHLMALLGAEGPAPEGEH